jgi:DNA-binding NarL/FixJ family response regulator
MQLRGGSPEDARQAIRSQFSGMSWVPRKIEPELKQLTARRPLAWI